MRIFDAMVQAVAKARADERKPRRWELNPAGYYTLLADERISVGHQGDEACPTFFGVPWAIDHADRSDDPKFRLIVDEIAHEWRGGAGQRRGGGLSADEFRAMFNKNRDLRVVLIDGKLTVPLGLNGDNIILRGQKGLFPIAWFKPMPIGDGIFQFAWNGARYDLPVSVTR